MKKILLVGMVLMLAAVAFPSKAQAGFIFGAGVGSNTVNIDEDFDESDMGWKAFVGFRFKRFFGIEAQYVEFGSPENDDFSADLTDFGGYVVGAIPIGDHFEINGKVGYHQWDVDLEDLNLDESTSESEWDISYGAGLAVIFKRIGFRAEYELFEVEETDSVTMASLSIEFRF